MRNGVQQVGDVAAAEPWKEEVGVFEVALRHIHPKSEESDEVESGSHECCPIEFAVKTGSNGCCPKESEVKSGSKESCP